MGCSQDVLNEKTRADSNYSTNTMEGRGLLSLSWDSVVSTDYQGDLSSLNSYSMSSMNPSEEKQKVEFVLHESGEAELTIFHSSKNEGIKIPHEDLPDDRPDIKKTVIFGGKISLFDGAGTLISSESIDRLDYSNLISDIKKIKSENSQEEISKALKSFQSQFFEANLKGFLEEIKGNKPVVRQIEEFQILEENETYVTIRVEMNPSESSQPGTNVLLIDKDKNRLVANRLYDRSDEVAQTTYYGYAKGQIEALDAIRIEEPFLVEEGAEITKVTLTKLSNLNISLN